MLGSNVKAILLSVAKMDYGLVKLKISNSPPLISFLFQGAVQRCVPTKCSLQPESEFVCSQANKIGSECDKICPDKFILEKKTPFKCQRIVSDFSRIISQELLYGHFRAFLGMNRVNFMANVHLYNIGHRIVRKTRIWF